MTRRARTPDLVSPNYSLTFVAHSINDTEQLAGALAELLPPGTVVALNGTLGSGKTRLVEAFAGHCEIERDDVTSPTFVLCQHYSGTRAIHHFDAYRLADEDEFLELGPEEYFESDGISFVEWSDRVASCLPPNHVRVEITVTGDLQREFHISSVGAQLTTVVSALAKRLESDR